MRRTPAIGRIFTFVLALVLAASVRPAEGLTFFDQRELSKDPLLPELRQDRTQVVLDLCGPWECVTGANDPAIPVWIPGCYIGSDDELTFRRTFALPDSLRALNFQLFVPESHYAVQVWVNGRMISSFMGGHLGFSCDMSRDVLHFGGSNEVQLKVSNELSPRASIPLAPQAMDLRNYGGIFSGAYLRGVPAWSVEEARILSRKIETGSQVALDVAVRIARYAANPIAGDSGGVARLSVFVSDSSGVSLSEVHKELSNPTSEETFQVAVSLPPFPVRLWSTAKPTRYWLTTALIAAGDTIHRRSEPIGFKSLEIRAGDFYLNGERLRLQGMDYVPEHPRGGRAIAVSQIRSDLTAMKDLGVNLIRVPGEAPPPALLNLADEMGMLVLVEVGLNHIPAPFLAESNLQQLSERFFGRMIGSFGNHACVLGWGIGSQLDWEAPATRQFNGWLYGHIKELDSRPCFVEGFGVPRDVKADFVLISAPPNGTSEGITTESDRPVLISRVGRLVCPGDPMQANLSSGLINQADYLIREISRLQADGSLDGYLIHAFADYHGESPLLIQPSIADAGLYGYGVVGFNRTERVVYFKLRDQVQTGQVSPPVPAPVRQKPPLAFPVVGLATLLIASVEMRRNNVFRQNLKRVFLHPHGFHMDLRYRRFLHTAQPLLLWLIESVTLSLLTVSFLYALRDSFVLDYYLTHFLPSPEWKTGLISLIWHPSSALLFFSALFLTKILLLTILIRLIAVLFRERMDFWQASNYVIWSFAALLFLLPVAVILFRTLETPPFFTLSLLVVGLGLLWCLQRLLSALRIGYGTTAWRIYLSLIVLLGIVIAGSVALLDHSQGTLAYMEYFDRVYGGLRSIKL